MKSLRRFLSAALLTFVLASATLADDGIIHGDLLPPPPPPPAAESTSQTASPETDTNSGTTNVSDTTSTVINIALSVLGGILTIY